MKSSTKLFLFMSFLACPGSFLNAAETEQVYMIALKQALEEKKQNDALWEDLYQEIIKLNDAIETQGRDIALQKAFKEFNQSTAIQKAHAVLLKKILKEAPVLTIEENKKFFKNAVHDTRLAFESSEFNKLLFDKPIDLHQQGNLRRNIALYLQKEGRDQESIDHFSQVGGECFALSFLWAYGKRLQDEPIVDPAKERDDYEFFSKVYRTLAIWDGKTDFTEDQKKDIERFISNIVLYQDAGKTLFNTYQSDLPSIFEDTKRGTLGMHYYSQQFYASKSMLPSYLQAFIKPKRILLIASNLGNMGHIAAIYQSEKDGSLVFYDSVNGEGEIAINSMEQLANEVWKVSETVFNEYGSEQKVTACQRLIPSFIITVYPFVDDPEYAHPTEKELKITVEELTTLVSNECFAHTTYKENKNLVTLMKQSPDTLIELLQNPDVSTEIKQRVVMIVVQSAMSPKLVKVRRYIAQNCQNLISTRKEKAIASMKYYGSAFMQKVRGLYGK